MINKLKIFLNKNTREYKNLYKEVYILSKINNDEVSNETLKNIFKKYNNKEYSIEELKKIKMNQFKSILNTYLNLAWKVKDNDNYLLGINTPRGIVCLNVMHKDYIKIKSRKLDKVPSHDKYETEEVLLRLCSLKEPLLVRNYR